MKKYIKSTGCVFIYICLLFTVACSKQNEPTPLIIDPQQQLTGEQEANLKAYKKSKHPIFFGWINQNPATPSMQSRLIGIPDSVDIVSTFTGFVNNAQSRADVKFLQEHKGTKVLFSEFWPLSPSFKSAKAVADSVQAWGLDGFELDIERGEMGDLNGVQVNVKDFIIELGKYLGPKSGTGKILAIDYAWDYSAFNFIEPYVDYFIRQAYDGGGDAYNDNDLQRKFDEYLTYSKGIHPEKFILTEWTSQNGNKYFEGGHDYTDKNGKIIPSLIGMAQFKPKQAGMGIGGIGSYVIQFGYSMPNFDGKDNPPNTYYYTRMAIQMMNPAVK